MDEKSPSFTSSFIHWVGLKHKKNHLGGLLTTLLSQAPKKIKDQLTLQIFTFTQNDPLKSNEFDTQDGHALFVSPFRYMVPFRPHHFWHPAVRCWGGGPILLYFHTFEAMISRKVTGKSPRDFLEKDHFEIRNH